MHLHNPFLRGSKASKLGSVGHGQVSGDVVDVMILHLHTPSLRGSYYNKDGSDGHGQVSVEVVSTIAKHSIGFPHLSLYLIESSV